jgi:UDP:flavonoid glycosyltransferase YjiC (YdhE family)
MPRASVVVTHGGFGTVARALGFGLPLVVVPYAFDQPEVAQRIVHAGAGVRLDPATLTPGALRDAVMTVLADPSYRTNARHIAEAMARHDGPAESARLLERLAGANRSRSRVEVSEPARHRAALDADSGDGAGDRARTSRTQAARG